MEWNEKRCNRMEERKKEREKTKTEHGLTRKIRKRNTIRRKASVKKAL